MIVGWKPSLLVFLLGHLVYIWLLQHAMKDCPNHGCHLVLSFIRFLNTLTFAKTHNLATKNPKLPKP
jgi:uncharacterized membrane protein YhhN